LFKLKELIDKSNRINEYDYEKMIKNFRLEDKQNKIKSKKLNKIKTHNKKWKGEVEKMKTETLESSLNRQNNLLKKYESKEKQLQSYKMQLNEKNLSNSQKLKNKNSIHFNKNINSVGFSKKFDEEERLHTQSLVEYKRKLISLILK